MISDLCPERGGGGGVVLAQWLTRKMARHAEKVADPISNVWMCNQKSPNITETFD